MFGLSKNKTAVENLDPKTVSPSPFQPRKHFDEGELRMLGESIRENGLIQPISVRRTAGGYELIAGERRLRASIMAGIEKIPAVVYEMDDEKSAVWALLENLQRSDLNPFEEAEALLKILSTQTVSMEEAAKKLGMAASTLSNKLRILRLPEEVRRVVTENSLTERHARELLRIKEPEEQLKAAVHIAKQKLNVPETVKYIDSLTAPKKPRKTPKYIVKDLRIFINTFEHAVEVMNFAGLGAVSTVTENGDTLTYSVSIPKERAFRKSKTERAAAAEPSSVIYKKQTASSTFP